MAKYFVSYNRLINFGHELRYDKTELNENFKLSEARSFFESTAKNLRLIDFNHSQESHLQIQTGPTILLLLRDEDMIFRMGNTIIRTWIRAEVTLLEAVILKLTDYI